MFIIVARNYVSGKMYKMGETQNKFDTYFRIEEFATDYVEKKMGRLNNDIYSRSKSRTWGKVPNGFFVAKHDKFPKMLVYEKKEVRGILYNTTKVNLVISFEICEIADEQKIVEDEEDEEFEFEGDKKNWEFVHKEITLREIN